MPYYWEPSEEFEEFIVFFERNRPKFVGFEREWKYSPNTDEMFLKVKYVVERPFFLKDKFVYYWVESNNIVMNYREERNMYHNKCGEI